MTDSQDQPLAQGPLMENDESTPIYDTVEADQVPVVLIASELVHDDEFPEEHIGEELIDPWVDPEQTDWPNAEDIEVREEKDNG